MKWENPYLPSFHSPGWLLRLLVGPHSLSLLYNCFYDLLAGFTVALTLIPQALSYATIANLPPINGLYASIFPNITYVFFGTSMQLALGPVAIVSSLVGGLVSAYGNEAGSLGAVDTAIQAALAMGIILFVMGLLNLGILIRFISKPVLVGFTTGAAMLIGASQLKNAFGIIQQVPQVGLTVDGYEYHYNYEVYNWYVQHWNDRDKK